MDAAQLRRQAEVWRAQDPDPQTAAELAGLLSQNAEAELRDRFGAQLEFGTAGLRGLLGAGPNRMNRAVVRRTTCGLARYLKQHVPEAARRGVVVGRDGRRMSREFAHEAAAVLAAEGVPALVFPDVVPTPVTAFACLRLRAAGAVMITASHNPPEYNGYKVYWENGAQIIPPHDQGIAQAIDAVEPAHQLRLADEHEARAKGLWRELPVSLEEEYLEAILGLLRQPRGSLPRLNIAYSALHGVGGRWVEKAIARSGLGQLHVVSEQQEPDGAFPTVRFPNPEEPGAMDLVSGLAERVKADLVLANDPDADRLAVMASDGEGPLRMLSGNEVGVLLGHYQMTQTRRGAQVPLVITTIVSSSQLGQIARDLGVRYEETLTGFKWIANRALELERALGAEFLFGYEEALGYTVGSLVRDKDGIGAALAFAELAAWCRARGTTVLGYLEEIQRQHGLFLARQVNFTFPGNEGLAAIRATLEGFRRAPPRTIGPLKVVATNDYHTRKREQDGAVGPLTLPVSNVIAYELEGGSRVTLRPSGTEPKIKYYFELREVPAKGEAISTAKERGDRRLSALIEGFLALARERGQPA